MASGISVYVEKSGAHTAANRDSIGIYRSGVFQARKYLEHILNTVEKLENDYPYYPECRHLATKSRMYRNIILDSHLIIYRITEERIEVLDIVHSASSMRKIKQARNIHIE